MSRLGVTLPLEGVPLSDHAIWLDRLEDHGYTDLWTAETSGHDAFTPLAVAAAATPRLRLGTAIASVMSRGPALLAMQAAAMCDVAPGRFVLGLGSSSPAIVSDWNSLPFEKPVERVRDTIRFLRSALAGQRVDERYETFRVQGFALERPPVEPPPLYVAALRERMLKLAGSEADGVVLGLVAPEDIARVAAIVLEAAKGEAREIVMRIGVTVCDDVERARRSAKRLIAAYLSLPTYGALHRWLGRGEQLDPMQQSWRRGERKAAVAAVPDALADALFVYGSAAQCRDQIQRFVDAGVSTPILTVAAPGGDLRGALRALAPRGNGR